MYYQMVILISWRLTMFYSLIIVLFIYCLSCCSVVKLCPTLCNPMNCNTPGFFVLRYLPEFAQTLVLWVGDATQPSHLLSPLLFLPSIFPSIGVFSNEFLLDYKYFSVVMMIQIKDCVSIKGWDEWVEWPKFTFLLCS